MDVVARGLICESTDGPTTDNGQGRKVGERRPVGGQTSGPAPFLVGTALGLVMIV
jgi:hypothetical protein